MLCCIWVCLLLSEFDQLIYTGIFLLKLMIKFFQKSQPMFQSLLLADKKACDDSMMYIASQTIINNKSF